MMNSKLETITPKIAQTYLDAVAPEKQRKLSANTVHQYAQAMRLGNWVLTHQGIAFDDAGNLCDGQHRMAAVIESGVKIEVMVYRGMPEKQGNVFTFDAIDRGANRGIGQQLQIRHGIQNACLVAGAARIISGLCARTASKMTVETTLAIYSRFGDSINFVIEAFNPTASLKKCSAIGSLAFCHRSMPKELSTFILRVGDGQEIKAGYPDYALRAYLLESKRNVGFLSGSEKACCLCSMHHVLGNKIKTIKSSMAGVDFFSDKQPRIVEEIRNIVM